MRFWWKVMRGRGSEFLVRLGSNVEKVQTKLT